MNNGKPVAAETWGGEEALADGMGVDFNKNKTWVGSTQAFHY